MPSSDNGFDLVRMDTPQGPTDSPLEACPACKAKTTEVAGPSYDTSGKPTRAMEGMAVVLRCVVCWSCWPGEFYEKALRAPGSVAA